MTTSDFAFDAEIVTAVLHHMNDDHRDDNLVIARAFGDPDATQSRMVGFDGLGGDWRYHRGADEHERALRVPWSTSISERAEVRREIVVVFTEACHLLGLPPR